MVKKIWFRSCFIALAFAHPAVEQPVSDPTRIEVYIIPYYNSDGPVIEIGRFSKGLAAKSEPEFVETILKTKQSWSELRFPEMYVAAVRLYDLGFRSESTYWFYSAQYRGRLFASLVDQEKMGSMGAPAFELVQAANAFQQLVGPYINGYGFGDIDRLVQIVERVQKENKTVPDLEKLYPGVTFKRRSEWDRNFALAYAGLSKVESWFYHGSDPVSARREKALVNANEALRLQPDLPEGHLALGYYYYYCDRDYEHALSEFEIAKRDLPNEAEAYSAIASIQRRQGKWTESNANYEKSIALDPKNVNGLFNLGYSHLMQRNFEIADKIFDRVLVAAPQSFSPRGMKGALAIMWKGDVRAAEQQLSLAPADYNPDGLLTPARIWVLSLQRKFPDALQVVQQFPGETFPWFTPVPCPKAFLEGRLYLYQGDKIKAQAALEQARTWRRRLCALPRAMRFVTDSSAPFLRAWV